MPNWVKVGSDVAVGVPAGAVDQLIANQDVKRKAEYETAGKTFGAFQEYGTWYNYGIPILAILGVGLNYLKGDWATRLVTAGSQLAARKFTDKMTHRTPAAFRHWRRENPGGGNPPVGGSILEI